MIAGRLSRRLRPFVAGTCAIVLVVGASACRAKEPPIRLNGRTLVIENQTREEWRDVTVTVNSYYRGQSRSVEPGARLEAGLSNFQTGLGQYFDPNRERVRTVEVRATTASGQPVALDWPER